MKLLCLLNALGEYTANSKAVLARRSEEEITSICSDSRCARKGSIFVCISGAFSDGHKYARSAASLGASVIIAEKPLEELPYGILVLTVKDTRRALALLAGEFYRHPDKEMSIVGITGTKGKTSVALTAKHILEENGIPCGYIGTNGIIFGDRRIEATNTTPDPLVTYEYLSQMKEMGIRHVMIEISSQALWQSRVLGISFEVCLFTNISEDHIGGFEHPTFEHYFDCKASLFTDYAPKHIVYNADEELFLPVIKKCTGAELHPYSITKKEGLYADKIESYKDGGRLGVRYECARENGVYITDIPTPGIHSVYNALAATGLCAILGVSDEGITRALYSCSISGRFEAMCFESKPGVTFVIDYAHNKLSLESVLNTLRSYPHERIITVVGSVGGRTYGRRKDIGEVTARLSDLTVLTADNPDFEPVPRITGEIKDAFVTLADGDRCYEIPDRRDAIEAAFDMAGDGDIVLLAGKGHESYQLVCGKRIPFSEKEILCEIDKAKRLLPV